MKIADQYIKYAKNMAQTNPEKGWERIKLGFQANCLRTAMLPNKRIAKGYQKLEDMMMRFVARSLSHEKSYIWGNIFAPCEIFDSMGLNMLSIECLSCYLSGFHLEEYFIDYAQSLGLAPTLCSYHKTFVGSVASGVVTAPAFAVSTSLTCDGNLNTFRYLQKKTGVPFVLLDVPYGMDEATVAYLAGQLEDMVRAVEVQLGCKCDLNKLKISLDIENQTRRELLKLYQNMSRYYYPGEVIDQLYMMMGVHLMMGTPEFLALVQLMNQEIVTCPAFTGKKILWVHLLPFYQETLQAYFNCNDDYQLMASDIVFDSLDELDPDKPFESLARKLIRNVYNGTYDHKAETIRRMAEKSGADAVIHFCHWGCKQADGGSAILKEEMKKHGIPMLILDGDGIDRRNSHDGQIKTRLEAFLEMMQEGQK